MPNTFTKIASVTVGAGGTTNLNFTSIPQTYTDLLLVYSLRGSSAAANQEFSMFLNNNGSGYSYRSLTGTGAAAVSNNGSSTANVMGTAATATASTFSNGQVYFPNYTDSNYKSYSIDQVTENNATTAYADLRAGLWSNTAAITEVSMQGSTIQQYSTATLYGIKNS